MLSWWQNFRHADLITLFDDIGIIIAFGTFMFSLLTWWNGRKQNVDISIELACGEQRKRLHQTIKRRHFMRSEVQGVLGNIYVDPNDPKGRYNIPFLRTKAFSKRLEAVQNGQTSRLIIEVDKDEFDNFVVEE